MNIRKGVEKEGIRTGKSIIRLSIASSCGVGIFYVRPGLFCGS